MGPFIQFVEISLVCIGGLYNVHTQYKCVSYSTEDTLESINQDRESYEPAHARAHTHARTHRRTYTHIHEVDPYGLLPRCLTIIFVCLCLSVHPFVRAPIRPSICSPSVCNTDVRETSVYQKKRRKPIFCGGKNAVFVKVLFCAQTRSNKTDEKFISPCTDYQTSQMKSLCISKHNSLQE